MPTSILWNLSPLWDAGLSQSIFPTNFYPASHDFSQVSHIAFKPRQHVRAFHSLKVPCQGAKQINKSHFQVPHLLQLKVTLNSPDETDEPSWSTDPPARGSASLLPNHTLTFQKWDVRDLPARFKTWDFYLSTPMVSISASGAEVQGFFPTTSL